MKNVILTIIYVKFIFKLNIRKFIFYHCIRFNVPTISYSIYIKYINRVDPLENYIFFVLNENKRPKYSLLSLFRR